MACKQLIANGGRPAPGGHLELKLGARHSDGRREDNVVVVTACSSKDDRD